MRHSKVSFVIDRYVQVYRDDIREAVQRNDRQAGGAMMDDARRRRAGTMSVYTMGIWQAKPGREEAFAAAWWELAEWTGREFLGVEKINGTLLRDRDQPGRFVSFGPWDSVDQIAAWRAHPGFRERVTRMNDFLASFTPAVLDPVPPSA